MIFDNIKNKERYCSLHPDLAAIFARLETMTSDSEAGRYEISENSYVNHMAITTIPESDGYFECHAKYADLQFVVEGCEIIDYCDNEGLVMGEDRLDTNDICFYEAPATFTRFTLRKGDFILVYPGEAHRPAVAPNGVPGRVVKSVGKIRM